MEQVSKPLLASHCRDIGVSVTEWKCEDFSDIKSPENTSKSESPDCISWKLEGELHTQEVSKCLLGMIGKQSLRNMLEQQ